tara:strand:+ start:644 stop:814 length:171 start_codon:yes stop_codon:yes gene_type:complete
MNTTNIITIIYFLGLIVGAFFFGLWDADTNIKKGLMALGWTAIYLVFLFKSDKKDE